MMNASDFVKNASAVKITSTSVEIEKASSKLLQPIYNGDDQPISTTKSIHLSVFDRLADEVYVTILYAYKPPNPSNMLLEQGLRKTLSEYREWAGRLSEDDNGQPIILLNDEGLRFTEASANCTLDQAFPFTTPTLLKLSPNFEGSVEELGLVQLTRFTCGSLVLSFSKHHIVADGQSVSNFMNAWGQACRGLHIHPLPLCDRNIFVPRNPYSIEFDHGSVEIVKRKSKYFIPLPYTEDDLVQQVLHCTPEFISKIKSKVSSSSSSSTISDVNGGCRRSYSTFVCLAA